MSDPHATGSRAATCPKCDSHDSDVLRRISGSDGGYIVPLEERRCKDCRWRWFEVQTPVNIDTRGPSVD